MTFDIEVLIAWSFRKAALRNVDWSYSIRVADVNLVRSYTNERTVLGMQFVDDRRLVPDVCVVVEPERRQFG